MSSRSFLLLGAGLGLLVGLIAGLGNWSAGAVFVASAVVIALVLLVAMRDGKPAHRRR
jgi:hypothetical protein